MFFISMPKDFKIGETQDCRINMKPARVTWRDKDTLVIEPDDARKIVGVQRGSALISFSCADADGTEPYVISDLDDTEGSA